MKGYSVHYLASILQLVFKYKISLKVAFDNRKSIFDEHDVSLDKQNLAQIAV